MFAPILLLAFPVLAVAQLYGPPPGPADTNSASSSSSAAPAIPTAPPSSGNQFNIEVAFNLTFTFGPSSITAPNGSIVTFYFPEAGLAHSVTQSSFANPCTPLAANVTAGTPAGFDSGLQQGVQFSLTITNDQIPIYFHCKQIDHCGMGMVGTINAPANGTGSFSSFQAAAMAIGANEITETDNGPVTGGVGAIATATPANTATAASSSGSSSSSSDATRVVVGSSAALIVAGLSAIIFA